MRGIVKFFKKSSSFGFIVVEGQEKDVFVHATDVEGGELLDGQHVEFEIETGNKGPKAKNVKVVAGEET